MTKRRHVTVTMSEWPGDKVRIWARYMTPCDHHGEHVQAKEVTVEQPHQVDPWAWLADAMAAAYDATCGCDWEEQPRNIQVLYGRSDRCDRE